VDVAHECNEFSARSLVETPCSVCFAFEPSYSTPARSPSVSQILELPRLPSYNLPTRIRLSIPGPHRRGPVPQTVRATVPCPQLLRLRPPLTITRTIRLTSKLTKQMTSHERPPHRTRSQAKGPRTSKQRRLKDSERKDICRYFIEHPKERQEGIAARFSVERSTICMIIDKQRPVAHYG